MYAGMRRGELQAVEDADVDLDANLIEVRYSWDQEAGRVAVKTKAGRRTLPIPSALRPTLLDHRMRRPWRDGLFFAASTTRHSRRPRSADARARRGAGRRYRTPSAAARGRRGSMPARTRSSRSACTNAGTRSLR
jgi:integrase